MAVRKGAGSLPVDGLAIWRRIETAFVGLKVPDIARRLGIEKQSVYKWRDGANLPGLDSLLKISELTGVSLHWILTGEGAQVLSNDAVSAREATCGMMQIPSSPVVKAALEELAEENGLALEEQIERVLLNGLVASDIVGVIDHRTARHVLMAMMDLTVPDSDVSTKGKKRRRVR